MSKEEKVHATCEGLQELEGHREMKALAPRNVPIDVFHDARKTLQAIEVEVTPPLSQSEKHNSFICQISYMLCTPALESKLSCSPLARKLQIS